MYGNQSSGTKKLELYTRFVNSKRPFEVNKVEAQPLWYLILADPKQKILKKRPFGHFGLLRFLQLLLPRKLTNVPWNQWLVQMYFLLNVRPFLGDIR